MNLREMCSMNVKRVNKAKNGITEREPEDYHYVRPRYVARLMGNDEKKRRKEMANLL